MEKNPLEGNPINPEQDEDVILKALNNPRVRFNAKQAEKLREWFSAEPQFRESIKKYAGILAKGTKDDIRYADVLLESIRSDIDLMLE